MPLIGMAGSTVMLLPLLPALRQALELEFEAFEVFGAFPQCVCDEVGPEARQEARKMAESSGIALAVHAPFTSLNIAALNSGIRAESLRQTLAAIDLCADLGGKTVIVHNGQSVLPAGSRTRVPQAFQLQWELNLDSLRKAAARARERGVVLCLENIGFEPGYLDHSVDDLLRIKEEVEKGSGQDPLELAFCLDVGHARLNRELESAIVKLGPWTRHVHLADNRGEEDDHLVIGEGNFDYSGCLDFFRNFPGVITLEVVRVGTDPAPAVKSRKFFRELLANPGSRR